MGVFVCIIITTQCPPYFRFPFPAAASSPKTVTRADNGVRDSPNRIFQSGNRTSTTPSQTAFASYTFHIILYAARRSFVSEISRRDHRRRLTFIHYSNDLNEDMYRTDARGLPVHTPFTLFPFPCGSRPQTRFLIRFQTTWFPVSGVLDSGGGDGHRVRLCIESRPVVGGWSSNSVIIRLRVHARIKELIKGRSWTNGDRFAYQILTWNFESIKTLNSSARPWVNPLF